MSLRSERGRGARRELERASQEQRADATAPNRSESGGGDPGESAASDTAGAEPPRASSLERLVKVCSPLLESMELPPLEALDEQLRKYGGELNDDATDKTDVDAVTLLHRIALDLRMLRQLEAARYRQQQQLQAALPELLAALQEVCDGD